MILYVPVTLKRHKRSLPRRFLVLKCCKKYLRASVLSTNPRKQPPELLSDIQTYYVWWKTIKHHNSLLTWPNFHLSPQIISPWVFPTMGNIINIQPVSEGKNVESSIFPYIRPQSLPVYMQMTHKFIVSQMYIQMTHKFKETKNYFSELQNFISRCHFIISS